MIVPRPIRDGVKTLCVCPAGMNTALFKGQKKLPGLPVKEPAEIAAQVVDAVQSQRPTLAFWEHYGPIFVGPKLEVPFTL